MHIEYTRSNEILDQNMWEALMKDNLAEIIMESLDAPSHITKEQYIQNTTVAYNRGTKEILIPIEEIECLLDNIVCTVNRWRTLQKEGENITVDTVVRSVLTDISHFDVCIQKGYVEGRMDLF